MKYECVKCKKTYDESEITMAVVTRLGGDIIEPYCEECYKKRGDGNW